MKRISIMVASMLLAVAALADTRTAQTGNDFVRLTTEVCTAQPVLDRIPEQYRNVVRDGTSFTGGREWHICWYVDGDKAHLLYEDGDQGLMPLSSFKKQRDA